MRNGVDVFETDVSAIAKRLDIDRDTRISFTEFNKFFSFPNYSKESIQYKSSNLTGSINRSNLYESKSSVRRYESPMRTTGSSLRSLNESYSPNKTVRFSSPLRESYTNPIVSRSPVLSRSPVITRNTVRSPIRTNLRSPIRSPIRSPLRTTLRSPLRVSDRSPNRSLLKSVDSLNRSVVRNNESFSVSKPSLSTYLSLEEENFQNFLNEIISVENEIERSKCNLALRSDFNVEDAFRIFELDSRGYVSDLDIKFGLNSLDLYPTSEEINLLLKRYDTRNTGAISYTSFFNMVAPLDREYRRMIEGRLPSEYVYRYNKSDVLLPTTKVYLQNLFSLMIKSEAKMEGWRQRLNTMVRFDVRRIFDKFDSIEKGYLSESDVKYVFNHR
jgi:Ca2+-binding EF-hand superfamily protein